jgi:polyisoprenoid-binding protein YceI
MNPLSEKPMLIKHLIAPFLMAAALLSSASAATFQSVIPEKSSITFKFKQMGVTSDGRFKKFSAQVAVDTDRPIEAKGSITIDLASIDTGSKEADQEAVGKAWFNVAAHPHAQFTLSQLTPAGPGQFQARGQLTIKGQSRDIVAPVKLAPQGLLTGSFVIKRADFGIGEGMWAKFDVVANEIVVIFNLSLK